MTFSIVAWDPSLPAGPEWGVAVASKFLAVGSVVPWARAGVGAVATQAHANVAYGPEGLRQMESGTSAAATVARLTSADPNRVHRQVGMVDASGNAATFTGEECFAWAGGTTGDGYACQGNILTGHGVVEGMAAAFEAGNGPLVARLFAALAAGDRAGGDRRGRQSAALLVVREGGGYDGGSDVVADLRVDDHSDPIAELDRLLGVHELIFPRPESLDFVEIDRALAADLRRALTRRGVNTGAGKGYSEDLQKALYGWVGMENLEERWSEEPLIERRVLEILLGRREA